VQRDLEKREWMLRRNCSLTPAQTAAAYAVLCLLSFSVAAVFLLQGYWLVLVFTVTELALVAVALLHYARHAADYEHIVLTKGCLLVERVSAGKVVQTQFDPHWTRVAVPERGARLIALESKGKKVEVGCFVLDAQRRQLARELRGALQGGRF
jgi:uncharacterized membrane protein